LGGGALDALAAAAAVARTGPPAPFMRADSFDPLSSTYKPAALAATPAPAALVAVALEATVAETVHAQFAGTAAQHVRVLGEISVTSRSATAAVWEIGAHGLTRLGLLVRRRCRHCARRGCPQR
jgi:hypothetical protein